MEELKKENERLRQENQALQQMLKQALERLAEAEQTIKQLKEQLGQNSRNSSWPSSRDKNRPKPKSRRQKSKRKAGGQKGHKGHTLEIASEPDVVEKHRPKNCAHCHQAFDEKAQVVDLKKRQVLDLPPLRFLITEHQAEKLCCQECGRMTMASFPEGVTHQVQYGQRVKQLAIYLKSEQFIPYERSRQLLADLFNLPITTGTLQNFVAQGAKAVEPVVEKIKKAIIVSEVAHADETGFYIKGKRTWLHTVSTLTLTYFAAHAKRGYQATHEIGILPDLEGVLMHDFWQAYLKYKQIIHALCHAHHLRDLTAIVENDKQEWAWLMIGFLLSAKQLVEEAKLAGADQLTDEQLRRIDQLYEAILSIGLIENPLPETPPPKGKRGRHKKTKARNLLERFIKHKPLMLRFIHDFKVPFDNNLAERDIRMMKVQQKVSGCFRSWDGAKQFCLLRSYISTVRKQGLNVWEALGSLFQGHAFIPDLSPV